MISLPLLHTNLGLGLTISLENDNTQMRHSGKIFCEVLRNVVIRNNEMEFLAAAKILKMTILIPVKQDYRR